jgi:hypothetical protein
MQKVRRLGAAIRGNRLQYVAQICHSLAEALAGTLCGWQIGEEETI